MVRGTGNDLDTEVTGLIGIYSDPDHVIAFADGEVRREFSISSAPTPTGSDLRTSTESSEVLWADPTHLDDLNINPSIRLRINDGLGSTSCPNLCHRAAYRKVTTRLGFA